MSEAATPDETEHSPITVVCHDASDSTVKTVREELRETRLRGWEVTADE